MTAVIALQALVFQDGGLLAMGANIFVMGIVTVWSGYFIYQAVQRVNRYLAGFVAGWLSVVLAAVVTAFLLALSGTASLGVVLTAMASVHLLIGVGEGLITVGALALVKAALPGMFDQQIASRKRTRPRSCGWHRSGAGGRHRRFRLRTPDGLERLHRPRQPRPALILPDYLSPRRQRNAGGHHRHRAGHPAALRRRLRHRPRPAPPQPATGVKRET